MKSELDAIQSDFPLSLFTSRLQGWRKRVLLALFCITVTLGMAGGAHAQSAPAWGYDTWGGTWTFGGSCPGGQTHTLGDATPSAVGEQVLALARLCAPYTYNNLQCTQTAVTAPIASGTSNCTYGGNFPGSFGVSITCSPGKFLTSAFPETCDSSAVTTVTLAAPPGGATAPASIALTATAANAFYGIASVKFYNGATLIGAGVLTTGTVSSGSYVTNAWTNVAAGTYNLTAVAADKHGDSVTSSVVTVTVGAGSGGVTSMYFIDADHLNTPRLVEDLSQQPVWKWEAAEAFGDSVPNGVSSSGTFVLNMRFPGQYFDQETGINYNNFRSYDPSTGKYVESDPLGLSGGMNSYAYVDGSPVSAFDFFGLLSTCYSGAPNCSGSGSGLFKQPNGSGCLKPKYGAGGYIVGWEPCYAPPPPSQSDPCPPDPSSPTPNGPGNNTAGGPSGPSAASPNSSSPNQGPPGLKPKLSASGGLGVTADINYLLVGCSATLSVTGNIGTEESGVALTKYVGCGLVAGTPRVGVIRGQVAANFGDPTGMGVRIAGGIGANQATVFITTTGINIQGTYGGGVGANVSATYGQRVSTTFP